MHSQFLDKDPASNFATLLLASVFLQMARNDYDNEDDDQRSDNDDSEEEDEREVEPMVAIPYAALAAPHYENQRAAYDDNNNDDYEEEDERREDEPMVVIPYAALAAPQNENQKAAYDAVQNGMQYTYDIATGAANGGYDMVRTWKSTISLIWIVPAAVVKRLRTLTK
jgi:hypothetical protein